MKGTRRKDKQEDLKKEINTDDPTIRPRVDTLDPTMIRGSYLQGVR